MSSGLPSSSTSSPSPFQIHAARVICLALIGYDGIVHWNLHFAPRRASLPIDPNIAALYATWGIVDSAEALLSSYDHPVLRPSHLADDVSATATTRVLPNLAPFGSHQSHVLWVNQERVEAHVVDVHGCVLLLFSANEVITTVNGAQQQLPPGGAVVQHVSRGGSLELGAPGDPFFRPQVSTSPSMKTLCMQMGAIVRCSCSPTALDASISESVLNAFDAPSPPSVGEQGYMRLSRNPKHWEVPLTVASLHSKLHKIGSALVQAVHCHL